MTELDCGAVDANTLCVPHPHAAGAPVWVIFTPAPGCDADLLWPAHSFPSAQSGVRASDLRSLQLRFCLCLLLVHNYCSAAVCSNCSFCRDWGEASGCDGEGIIFFLLLLLLKKKVVCKLPNVIAGPHD